MHRFFLALQSAQAGLLIGILVTDSAQVCAGVLRVREQDPRGRTFTNEMKVSEK